MVSNEKKQSIVPPATALEPHSADRRQPPPRVKNEPLTGDCGGVRLGGRKQSVPVEQIVQSSPGQDAPGQAVPEPAWFYLTSDNQTVGPVTQDDLTALLKGAQLNGESLVWTEGMAAWQSAAAAGLVLDRPTVPPGGQNCPACGKPLAAGAKFCGGCGAKIGVSGAPAATSAPAVCSQCRAELKPQARFCGKCGQRVS